MTLSPNSDLIKIAEIIPRKERNWHYALWGDSERYYTLMWCEVVGAPAYVDIYGPRETGSDWHILEGVIKMMDEAGIVAEDWNILTTRVFRPAPTFAEMHDNILSYVMMTVI